MSTRRPRYGEGQKKPLAKAKKGVVKKVVAKKIVAKKIAPKKSASKKAAVKKTQRKRSADESDDAERTPGSRGRVQAYT